jgi:FemAB-related protein (PEP-CTERM system-associated)
MNLAATPDSMARSAGGSRAAQPCSVRMLSDSDLQRWDDFVYGAPHATFFHRSGWKSVIEKAFGHRTYFLLAEAEGAIRGVLPLAEIKSPWFGHSLMSLPFCVYGGIVADSEGARTALDNAAQALARERGVDFLEYRNLRVTHPEWEQRDLYVTFRKELLRDDEENLQAIPRKQRAMVRKGIQAGLAAEVDVGIERFFSAYSDSLHRLGTPVFSKRYFRLLREEFGSDCDVLTIVKDKEVIASVLSFYFRDEILPYYGGGVSKARDLAGNDFMYWELMRHATRRGCRVFDFGRSKRGTGSFGFKKNWGFEPLPLAYEYQLHRAEAVPEHSPLNPKYALLIKLWRRMPRAFANHVGPHIIKQLG